MKFNRKLTIAEAEYQLDLAKLQAQHGLAPEPETSLKEKIASSAHVAKIVLVAPVTATKAVAHGVEVVAEVAKAKNTARRVYGDAKDRMKAHSIQKELFIQAQERAAREAAEAAVAAAAEAITVEAAK